MCVMCKQRWARDVVVMLQHAQEAATVKLEDEANHVALDPPPPSLQVFTPQPDNSDAGAQNDGPGPMAVGEDDSVRNLSQSAFVACPPPGLMLWPFPPVAYSAESTLCVLAQ